MYNNQSYHIVTTNQSIHCPSSTPFSRISTTIHRAIDGSGCTDGSYRIVTTDGWIDQSIVLPVPPPVESVPESTGQSMVLERRSINRNDGWIHRSIVTIDHCCRRPSSTPSSKSSTTVYRNANGSGCTTTTTITSKGRKPTKRTTQLPTYLSSLKKYGKRQVV